MTDFTDVNIAGSSDRRDHWQKHHIVPTAIHNNSFSALFQAIEDSSLPENTRYDHDQFDFNGLLLPETPLDSVAFGFAVHNGSHGDFSAFVSGILSEIQVEFNALAATDPGAAAEQAARSVRGLQAYLIDHLTIDRQINPVTGEYLAHAAFYLSSNDPWLALYEGGEGAIYANITLDDIRGGSGEDMSLPFWQGYHGLDASGDWYFAGSDYDDRAGSIYDPYFKYGNGVYASSVERFLARERGVDLGEVTDFVDLRLGELLVDPGDGFRPNALVLNDVVFFQENADYTATIGTLTARIDGGLAISPGVRPNTLMMTGAIGPFQADYAFAPDGTGFLLSTPTTATFQEFLNVTDEIVAAFPDLPFVAEIATGLDALQDYVGGVITEAIGSYLSGLELPRFTIAKDGVGGLGHAGNDFMLGLGSASLAGQEGQDWIVHLGSGEVHGGDGDDRIFGIGSEYLGPGQALELHGDDGDDFIGIFLGEGGFAYGGAGDDILIAGGGESHLSGGEGEDTFFVGSRTFIEDADSHDRVYYAGVPIYGGAKQWWMEGNTAYWAPFSAVMSGFPVVGSQILTAGAFFVDVATMKFASFQRSADGYLVMGLGWGHGGTAAIKDYHLDLDSGVGSGGITVFQHEWADDFSFENLKQYLNLALKAGFGVGLYGFDPLVLDLDGDGYELTTEGNSRAHFEFDNDGFGERTGWVRPDDGLLAIDLNANGTIDGIGEAGKLVDVDAYLMREAA